jgi:hypothetical protein
MVRSTKRALTPVEPTHAEESKKIMSTAQTEADAKLMTDGATTGDDHHQASGPRPRTRRFSRVTSGLRPYRAP